jgi:glutamine---fructose-6-phosphate transaminase (isomerizing)
MSVTVVWYISFQAEIYTDAATHVYLDEQILQMTPSSAPVSLLQREILEQGSALAARAPAGWEAAGAAAGAIAHPSVDYLLIAARGSSDNAARFAQYALGAETHLNVALAAPSLFTDPDDTPDLRGAAVLGISQSGQSPDIVGVLAAARRQGRPTIALTNDETSPLAAAADVVVPLATGPERSVAATKTYLASLHAIEQLVERLHPDAERARWLERLPGLVDEAVAAALARQADFDALDGAAVLTTVGRGLDFSTAHETALKIRELSGMLTEAFSPADLLHGPVAALGGDGALWVVDTRERLDDAISELLARVRERGLRTVLASRHAPPAAAPGALHLALPAEAPHWVATILALLPGQVAAMRLAERRGVDLDHPHGLTKVTLTR